jgi:two-component system sensor histidine kinase MtrB
MTEPRQHSPRRFRRRLTAAFVLVAGVSAGVVVVVTFVLAREYRWRTTRSTSFDEARFALAVAPDQFDSGTFERFRTLYEQRSDADILVIDGPNEFTSGANLSSVDIPGALSNLTSEPMLVNATVDGRPVLVAGAISGESAELFLFFSLEQLDTSLVELAQTAVFSWLVTLIVGAAVGWMIARRTLKPVAETASAAEAIAGGDLTTRLPDGATDEFGTLATSFNHMADEVESLIRRLAEAADRERRFTADVAHELRTPLTGLAASTAILREQLDTLPPSSRRPATILVADVERLRDLVLELLELTRLDATTEPPTPSTLQLRGAIDAVIAETEVRRDADIVIDVDPRLHVTSAPAPLRRILSNLIDNAIVHGGATVHLSARRTGSAVSIDVIDDGPGVATEDLDKIFDRFYKADRSRASGGSGLGLAIAREYARSQDGSLTVTNEPGHGARFTLRLPATARSGDELPTSRES